MDHRRLPLDHVNCFTLPFKLPRTELNSSAFHGRDVYGNPSLHSHILYENARRMPQMRDYFDLPFTHQLPGSSPSIMQRTESPFTKEQFVELNHQTLIYNYIMEGLKPPPALLFQLRNSVAALSRATNSSRYHGNFVTLNMDGCNNNNNVSNKTVGSKDEEPGRCRRTDGKKWRCAREVVPDHKYCERHIHRGRHRPKKHAAAAAAPGIDEHISASSASSTPSVSPSPASLLQQLPLQSTGLSLLGNKASW